MVMCVLFVQNASCVFLMLLVILIHSELVSAPRCAAVCACEACPCLSQLSMLTLCQGPAKFSVPCAFQGRPAYTCLSFSSKWPLLSVEGNMLAFALLCSSVCPRPRDREAGCAEPRSGVFRRPVLDSSYSNTFSDLRFVFGSGVFRQPELL